MLQGLNTGLSALYAAQKRIETTGNNIANANTEGYTRQRVDTVPTAYGQAGFWSASTINVGSGTTIQDIKRVRDQFLEDQALAASSKNGVTAAAAGTYGQIEAAFGEPGSEGIQKMMENFFGAWNGMKANEGGLAAVVGAGNNLASRINDVSQALSTMGANQLTSLKNDVASINGIATRLADLNKAISTLSNTQGDTNNLLDQRDNLVRQLSSLTNVTTNTNAGGQMTVSINGATLVSGDQAKALKVDSTGSPTVVRFDLGDGLPSSGNVASITAGTVGGTLGSMNGVIPQYQAKLDAYASSLISTVNAIHASGYDGHGNAGGNFFTGTDASSLAVDPAVLADPFKVAYSGEQITGGSSLDIENARKLAAMMNSTSPTSSFLQYKNLVTGLGTDSLQAQSNAKVQASVLSGAEENRDSVGGVNIDEEMTNLIQFQNSYSAAAKYIATLQEVMDSLINMVR